MIIMIIIIIIMIINKNTDHRKGSCSTYSEDLPPRLCGSWMSDSFFSAYWKWMVFCAIPSASKIRPQRSLCFDTCLTMLKGVENCGFQIRNLFDALKTVDSMWLPGLREKQICYVWILAMYFWLLALALSSLKIVFIKDKSVNLYFSYFRPSVKRAKPTIN